MLSLSATLTGLIALATGRPIELHDVYLGSQTEEDDDTLHFVSYYRNVDFFQYLSGDSQTYRALGMARAGIKKSVQAEVDSAGYRIDNVNKAMGAYAATQNFRNKRIVTRLVFRGSLDSAENAKVIFDGIIQSVLFKKSTMEVSCVPIISSLAFETGWPYQINCNAKFGDVYCKVNKNSSDNRVIGAATGGSTGTLIDTNGLTQTDDWWNHGIIEFTSGNNNRLKRKVVDFDAATDTITLDYALENAVVSGDTYVVNRGCDKTLSMCQTLYNNEDNYHGFHAIPLTT